MLGLLRTRQRRWLATTRSQRGSPPPHQRGAPTRGQPARVCGRRRRSPARLSRGVSSSRRPAAGARLRRDHTHGAVARAAGTLPHPGHPTARSGGAWPPRAQPPLAASPPPFSPPPAPPRSRCGARPASDAPAGDRHCRGASAAPRTVPQLGVPPRRTSVWPMWATTKRQSGTQEPEVVGGGRGEDGPSGASTRRPRLGAQQCQQCVSASHSHDGCWTVCGGTAGRDSATGRPRKPVRRVPVVSWKQPTVEAHALVIVPLMAPRPGSTTRSVCAEVSPHSAKRGVTR